MARVDFNAEGVEARRSFDVLPDNTEVLCHLVSSDWKDSSNGGRYIALVFDVIDGPHVGRSFFDNLNLDMGNRDDDKAKKAIKIAESALAELCRACGKVAIAETDELHGIPLVLRLGIDKARGDFPEKNKIKEYKRANARAASSDEKPAAPSAEKKQRASWAR